LNVALQKITESYYNKVDDALEDESINTFTDVDTITSTPNIGDTLTWDGANWVPGAVAGGGTSTVDLSLDRVFSGLEDATFVSSTSFLKSEHGFDYINKIFFNDEGTKVFFLDVAYGSPYSKIFEYSLSIAYDLNTANYVNAYLLPQGIDGAMFNADGTILFLIQGQGSTNDPSEIYEHVLTTPYDLSLADLNNPSKTFDFSNETNFVNSGQFANNGTRFYATDGVYLNIHEYVLTTPYDISTMSYNNSVSTNSIRTAGISGSVLSDDGTVLISYADVIYESHLSTPFDITSLTNVVQTFAAPFSDGVVTIVDNGRMYVMDTSRVSEVYIEEYDISTSTSIISNINGVESSLDLTSLKKSLQVEEQVTNYLAPQELTEASNILYDVSLGVNAHISLTTDGNTLSLPTNSVIGQSGTLSVITNGNSLIFDSGYEVVSGDVASIATTVSRAEIAWRRTFDDKYFLWITTI